MQFERNKKNNSTFCEILHILFCRLEARTNLQIKHSFTMMLNSVSEEDCSLTIRLVQNHFKGRQPVISKYYRYLVDSLHEVTHSIFTALAPLTSPEEGTYSNTCLERPLKKKTKTGFQD